MEDNSENVKIGRFISENTFSREDHEIQIDDIVIDFYDAQKKIIHEIKKSDALHESHIWQVKHYIAVLEDKGVKGVTGMINYPEQRKTVAVQLNNEDKITLLQIKKEIEKLRKQVEVPKLLETPFCTNCAYFDFCYIDRIK
jgi:CRISPR-associated exonuclease Cas4